LRSRRRYFIDDEALTEHMRSKIHKRRSFLSIVSPCSHITRLKQLDMPAYTQKEADAAAGLGTYVAPVKQPIPETLAAEMKTVSEFAVKETQERIAAIHAVPDL
jgi:hypothetical protein